MEALKSQSDSVEFSQIAEMDRIPGTFASRSPRRGTIFDRSCLDEESVICNHGFGTNLGIDHKGDQTGDTGPSL